MTCELCNGTGYFKSNTAEYEGDCPNGCKSPAWNIEERLEQALRAAEGEVCQFCKRQHHPEEAYSDCINNQFEQARRL